MDIADASTNSFHSHLYLPTGARVPTYFPENCNSLSLAYMHYHSPHNLLYSSSTYSKLVYLVHIYRVIQVIISRFHQTLGIFITHVMEVEIIDEKEYFQNNNLVKFEVHNSGIFRKRYLRTPIFLALCSSKKLL